MVLIRKMPQEEIQKCVSFFYDILRKNELKLCSNPENVTETIKETSGLFYVL